MPALDLPALQKQIASRRLAPVYLFVGEDVRLIDQLIDAVEATVDPADRPFAVERLYAAEQGSAPIDIAAVARVFPMLGDRRIVIVLRAERLLKPKRAGKATDVDDGDETPESESIGVDLTPLDDYLNQPVPSTTLLFVATEIDRSRRFTKRLIEKALVTTFAGLNAGDTSGRREVRRAVAQQMREEIERRDRTIDPEALQLLVERSGSDISKLRGDVERLLLYTEGQRRISREDVEETVSIDSSVEDEWAIVNAIADGDAARALRETALRLDRGDSPHALIGQLRWWVSTRLSQGAPERVKAAIDALMRTDLALKSSGGDERVLIERLVVELTGRAVPRQTAWAERR